jgi:methylmalonyl-CoA mutase
MLSRLDPWVNLLRLTAAGFAGGVGGADAVILDGFTQPIGRSLDFARRQARNTQLVLMEEANLGRVADPSAGSRFLDSVTEALIAAAYAEFQRIETEGGVVESLRSGALQERIAKARVQRAKDVASRKAGLIGVSEFPILGQEVPAVDATDAAAFARPAPRHAMPGPDSKAEPLRAWRKAEPFENLRNAAETLGDKASALLATLGSLKDYSGRQGFSANALAAGGLATRSIAVEDFEGPAPLVILCGSDEGYETSGAAAVSSLKARGAARVFVAGRPSDALSAAGADGYLYMGADLVAALSDILEGLK